ncbi:MAG TPA: 2-oxoglutarate dehydrogenase complex dihydrolipoyllysine-residue succinyltransferase [Candidatus Methylomirabilis sp.]|nr:2-oxoglutarate dehydrogenase complex dihydrolipoyllysine-residue succinyltransferase [Candidatus Methylomirabilis sp.]
MPTNIVVPEMGESVVGATVARWLKQEGERVAAGEAVVELETEKVDLEVAAEQPGILMKIGRPEGEEVRVGDVLGVIEEGPAMAEQAPAVAEDSPRPAEGSTRVAPGDGGRVAPGAVQPFQSPEVGVLQAVAVGPAKEERQAIRPQAEPRQTEPGITPPAPATAPGPSRREERVRMSRRRQTIARRLVEAQHTAAMLTTFNEIDMAAVMDLRTRRKDAFKERHKVNLGITSFFVKAAIGALREFPRLNAEIQDDEMVLKYYYDIGIAVGATEGLVVPVLRDADRLSFAEIEQAVKAFAQKAEVGTLSLEDLRGGTFTVTNGGIFGSLLSTPILNPPQVSILGLHKIEARPVVQGGNVVVRPMMYVALSYDHRIVDGREAVQFLVRVKELVEEPERLLLEG